MEKTRGQFRRIIHECRRNDYQGQSRQRDKDRNWQICNGEEKVIDFPIRIRRRRLYFSGHLVYTRAHVSPGRPTKASYFTGTVAISVNTIKPSVHVQRLRQSLRVWKYLQEGHPLFSNAKRDGRGTPLDSKLSMESFALWPFVYTDAKVLQSARSEESSSAS